jgi:hypothetical protein
MLTEGLCAEENACRVLCGCSRTLIIVMLRGVVGCLR